MGDLVDIDRCAKFIIEHLNNLGYKAYVVGGCVRDSLLGKKPKDWDICTNAFPQTVHNIFESMGLTVIDTGIKYGTVSIVMAPTDVGIITQNDERYDLNEMEPNIYEVTTFRKVSGSRKMLNVEFGDSIEDDLLRRDFSINALAYNPNTGIIDICNGREDLHNKIIRCVGDARQRLSEDWIRIMRAIRFQAQLGFEMDDDTSYWVNHLANLVNETSSERVQAEFIKILIGDYADKALLNNKKAIGKIIPEIKGTIGFNQNNINHIYDVYTHSVKAINILINIGNTDSEVRMATFLHDIAKPITYSTDENGTGHFYNHAEIGHLIVKNLLKRLNFNNNFITNVCNLVKYHDREIPTKSSVKRLVNKVGTTTLNKLLYLKYADVMAQSTLNIDNKIHEIQRARAWLDEIIENNETFKITDLDISGRDLIRLGYTPSLQFSIILNNLLENVIEGKLENKKEILINYVVNSFELN